MRSGSVLVVVLGCTWSACLDTQPDKPPTRDSTFAAWDAGAGSEKPPQAVPVAARAANAQAGTGGPQQRAKPLQPSAAGARAGSAAEPPRSGARTSGSAGSAGAPTQPQVPALPAPEHSGDLIITELMIDPKALADAEGEWLELYNATSSALELRDCHVDDGGKSLHALAPVLHVEPGAYITIARSAAPGFKPDATLALSLTNSADSVAIVCRGIEIDRVSYDRSAEFVIKPGVSLALDPSLLDEPRRNDAASAWCEGRDAYSTDLGSPGRANPSCHSDDSDQAGQPESDTDDSEQHEDETQDPDAGVDSAADD